MMVSTPGTSWELILRSGEGHHLLQVTIYPQDVLYGHYLNNEAIFMEDLPQAFQYLSETERRKIKQNYSL